MNNSGNDAGAVGRLIAELRHAAARSSDFSRRMAEDKSLRQESNHERRTDLYMWPTPEQTLEGRAADLIARLTNPAEPSEICAKLRRQDLFDLHGSVALVNPDGPAAASIIERLTASLVEVRDALAQCYIEKQSADGDPRLQRADEALAMTKGGGNELCPEGCACESYPHTCHNKGGGNVG